MNRFISVRLAQELCGVERRSLQRLEGSEATFHEQFQLIVQIDARHQRPIGEVCPCHNRDAGLVHHRNQFHLLSIHIQSRSQCCRIITPKNESAIIGNKSRHKPSIVSGKALKQLLPRQTPILIKCLVDRFGSCTLLPEGASLIPFVN